MSSPGNQTLPRAGLSNTLLRVVTAAVLIPMIVGVVLWGSITGVAILAFVMALLALLEFFSLGQHVGLRAYRGWTLFCAVGVFVQQWLTARGDGWTLAVSSQRFGFGGILDVQSAVPRPLPLELILFVFVLGAAVILIASRRPLTEALGDLSISAAGLIFIVLPLSTVIRIDGVGAVGPKLLLFTLVLVWVGDTLAYFVGRAIGRSHMAPHLSPGKTWEGAAANIIGAGLVGVVFARWLGIATVPMVICAALASVSGQIGDLVESGYKRAAGVKDSGSLLPGHGGMLDRIDALIFAAPVVWYYFELVMGPR